MSHLLTSSLFLRFIPLLPPPFTTIAPFSQLPRAGLSSPQRTGRHRGWVVVKKTDSDQSCFRFLPMSSLSFLDSVKRPELSPFPHHKTSSRLRLRK